MNTMTRAESGPSLGIASTHGWDTAYGIRFSRVNAAIAAQGSSPSDFDHTQTSGGQTNRIFGTFGDWSIVDGSGHLLEMRVPVPSFTFEPDGQAPITRSDAVALITVELEAIPQPGATSGTNHALKVKLPNRSNASVSVTSFTYPGSDSDGVIPNAVRLLLQDWMRVDENLARFNHTFAVVNLNGKAAVRELQWVMPTTLSYGVVSRGEEDGIFAVLCMTEGNSAPADTIVSPDLVPPGKTAALLLSKERYLRKMVLPGLGFLFTEPKDKRGRTWPKDYFAISGNGTQVTNLFDLEIDPFVTEHGPVRATIAANKLNVTLEDLYLDLGLTDFTHPYRSGWFTAVHNISSRMQAALTPHNKFILIPAAGATGEPILTHTAVLEKTDIAKAFDYLVIAVEIAAFVLPLAKLGYARYAGVAAQETTTGLSAANTVVQSGKATTAKALPVLTAGGEAIQAGAAALPTLSPRLLKGLAALGAIALGGLALGLERYRDVASATNEAAKEIPDIKAFVTSIMTPVQWPDEAAFTVESVAFNGGFHIVGQPEDV